ncbi:MAG: 4Fe-4S binding protein [Desulfobacterota bacterium]|nr:4Fe-4S binding protein [Thermodesulfobacteriota bacterium]
MQITRQRFIDINKYVFGGAALLYVNALFDARFIQAALLCIAAVGTYNLLRQKRVKALIRYAPIAAIVFGLTFVINVRYLQPGLIVVCGTALFSLLHIQYFSARPRIAAAVWGVPFAVTLLTYSRPLCATTPTSEWPYILLTLTLCLIPACVFASGTSSEPVPKKPRLKVVKTRIMVQTCVFMLWAWVTAIAFIKGSQVQLLFWGLFNVFTVALFPFFFGRVLCGWLCPNATMQDALLKNLHYTRPIQRIPQAIDEQTHASAMYISGHIDQNAPYMPATLLMAWFPMFFLETIYDLTGKMWYPVAFMYGLMLLSLLLPWRKLCAQFCWLSSYRGLAGHNSLWRLRFNRSKCRQCKRCAAEEACPYYIDIRNQDNEMPVTCCVCFSCMEACPFGDVITFRRAPEERQRVKAF